VAFAERIRAERIYVACLGQFKRGKTTLLNALVGEAVLPSGVLPITTVPTIVRFGPERSAHVRSTDGTVMPIALADLGLYVGEQHNPRNIRGVEAVEVFVPSEALATGLCLVDTPGLGSTDRQSAALTRRLVPRIDAVIMVLGVDPPLAGDELDLLAEAATQTAELIVVLNKSDRFDAADRRAACTFAGSAIAERVGRPIDPILQVSAAERMAGEGPERDWPALRSSLANLVDRRQAILRTAHGRGAQQLVHRCLVEVGASARAVFQPLGDSEDLAARLTHAIGLASLDWLLLRQQAERAVREAERDLRTRRDAFLSAAVTRVGDDLRAAAAAPLPRSARRDHALDLARRRARADLLEWLSQERAMMHATEQRLLAELLAGRRQAIASARRASAVADDGTAVPPLAEDLVPGSLDAVFAAAAPDHPRATSASHRLWDRLLSRRRAATRVANEARAEFERTLARGTERALLECVAHLERTIATVQDDVDRAHRDARDRVERALRAARAARAAGTEGVHRELDRLAALRREVEALREGATAPDARQSR